VTVATTNPISANAAAPPPAIARVGLRTLFWFAANASWVLVLCRPAAITLTRLCSPSVRRGTRLNATRIFDRPTSARDHRRFCHAVVGSFYDFVVEVGRCGKRSVDQLRNHVAEIDGHDRYVACRQSKRGAVLVTAHMGSFEAGLSALRDVEPNIHVVFKRDSFDGFEKIRSRMRAAMGVHEAPIDDGWPALVALRDALRDDHVVVMQADRAIPGQRFANVPFLRGHLRLPLGPIKLAQLTESPIVPVFTTRNPDGRFCVHLEAPIYVNPDDPDAALMQMAAAIESYVSRYPEQWLVLSPAFTEDLA
jgi:phosphatidylinositol dimannoside acyltransferase